MKWRTELVPQMKKESVQYVYPNLVSLPQRGSLEERWQLAIKEGCDYVEMAADFIKNKTEMQKTGKDLGEMLDREDIATLYNENRAIPSGASYILHTDPSIPRRGEEGHLFLPILDWEDPSWVMRLTDMVLMIQERIGIPATAIEIHSGTRETSLQSIVAAVKYMWEMHHSVDGRKPLILIENKIGRVVSNAESMAMLWRMLVDNGLENNSGIMLDIPNLFKTAGKRFKSSLEAIPNDAIKGMHIHWHHRAPAERDPLDWDAVFDKVVSLDHQLILNPEVFHGADVPQTISFCEHMIGRWESARDV